MANVTTTTAVDTFMQSADAAAMRTVLGLGDSATKAVGTTAGTVAAGNDSRIVGAVQTSRTISTGIGLAGGGDLSANRTLSVSFGNTFSTACRGDDARLAVDANYAVFVHGPTPQGQVATISIPTQWGIQATALADIILCSGGGGGGAGMISPSNLMATAMGGGGGGAGILRVLRGLYMDGNDALRASIGAGGAGGVFEVSSAPNFVVGQAGANGTGSSVVWNNSDETILDCGLGTSGLNTTGGAGGNANTLSDGGYVNNQTSDLDLTINTPYKGGVCGQNGEAFGPTLMVASPIATPWQQSGGAGGGSTTQNIFAGANGGNAWGIQSSNLQNPDFFGQQSNGFNAILPSSLGPTSTDLILRFFHRGIGGSGGGGANSYNPGVSCIDDMGTLAAGNGTKGAPGCGGGGGGGFTVDQSLYQAHRAGSGGDGGDGFIIVIFHRLT